MKNKKYLTVLAVVTAAMVMILVFSEQVKEGGINGLIVCGNVLIPSLFPFAVLSVFLTNSGLVFYVAKLLNKPANILFNMSGNELCIMLLSMIGGYPIGATLIFQAFESGIISELRAKHLSYFCVNAGPAFIVMAVGGGIMHSKTMGLLLLSAHISAALILAAFYGKLSKNTPVAANKKPKVLNLADSFVNATALSSNAILGICSWVVLFSALSNILNYLLKESAVSKYMSALFEVTNGVIIMYNNVYIVSFLLGFAGLCVHLQVISALKSARPNYGMFFLSRIVHGIVSIAILKLLLIIFPQSVETLSNGVEINFKGSYISIFSSLALILMSVCLLMSAKNSGKSRADMVK